jgi:hypothetical protein
MDDSTRYMTVSPVRVLSRNAKFYNQNKKSYERSMKMDRARNTQTTLPGAFHGGEQTTLPGTFHGGEQTTLPGTFHGGEQTTLPGTFHSG